VVWDTWLKPGAEAEGLRLTRQVWSDMRSFEGYLGHQFLVDQEAPGHLIALGRWRSREDADRVRERYRDSGTIRRLAPLLARPRDRWVTAEDEPPAPRPAPSDIGRTPSTGSTKTSATGYSLLPVGFVRSRLTARKDAPRQGSEGAPAAWVEFDPAFAEALDGIAAGQEVILLTWLHQGRRDVLRVRPRDDPRNALKGVFATRSPDRPNPIGLHRVRVSRIEESTRVLVEPLEAIDGTPVVDVKPVLPASIEGRGRA
ncbi:MAG TPA: tRNA (N6-threonylcarbamoyladenosine(37)-N6)-methyltransferase TrmO, partial [Candidatus Methylomirabilis sp.]|nr:tRNA (N6-threonylcarbamoyladenosine(37)-N6)-methyltransferase TrmO [Candidatus Methylomirabilis sp.]